MEEVVYMQGIGNIVPLTKVLNEIVPIKLTVKLYTQKMSKFKSTGNLCNVCAKSANTTKKPQHEMNKIEQYCTEYHTWQHSPRFDVLYDQLTLRCVSC